jgi:hypothetical protein
MRCLTEKELLDFWEESIDLPPVEGALTLIGVASSNLTISEIAALSIGQRDIRLLQLRQWLFGSHLRNIANCPHCSERVEWENEIGDLRLQPLIPGTGKSYTTEMDGFIIRFRLPTSQDLIFLKNQSSQTLAKELLNQCILSVEKENTGYDLKNLPEKVIEHVNSRMSEEDPQADIRMLLSCPSCKTQWESCFDILSYLWTEINSWAKYMLQEIYILAKSFGWSENNILEIGPKRRRFYLEMLKA